MEHQAIKQQDYDELQLKYDNLRAICEAAVSFLTEIDNYHAERGQATPETVLELRGMIRAGLSC